jgi:NADH-quinone oxidoreductase subunit J
MMFADAALDTIPEPVLYGAAVTQASFWILAVISVLSAIAVIWPRTNPIFSALYLVVTFFAIAGQFILLNAQFLAAVHVIVYAGAIMVLFLFVIMLLNLNKDAEPRRSFSAYIGVVVAGGLMSLTLVAALRQAAEVDLTGSADPNIGLVETLGQKLFTDFRAPFELTSVLFLAAMVGAVLLSKRDPSKSTSAVKPLSPAAGTALGLPDLGASKVSSPKLGAQKE